MPSARAELWVTYRDSNGRIATPPAAGATAKLKMVGLRLVVDDTELHAAANKINAVHDAIAGIKTATHGAHSHQAGVHSLEAGMANVTAALKAIEAALVEIA